jgi:hypothetical protein
MENTIYDLLCSATYDLFKAQPDILNTTTQTTMTEWNLAHHYSHYLSKYLFWYDLDNDIVKRNHSNRRPDIILHKRQSDYNNFLVIEMKISTQINDKDKNKIKTEWFGGNLKYRYGACLSINSKNCISICVMKNSSITTDYCGIYSSIKEPIYKNKNLDNYEIIKGQFKKQMKKDTPINDKIIKETLDLFRKV